MTAFYVVLIVVLFRWHPRKPDFVIGGDERPYMKRWWVTPWTRLYRDVQHRTRLQEFVFRLPGIYLHKIIRSDDDRGVMHDHPRDNISVVLWRCYRELMPNGVTRIRGPGSIVLRRAEARHTIEVVDGPVWSLFIVGPWRREWGFWCDHGFVPWFEFTRSKEGRPGENGKGCEQ